MTDNIFDFLDSVSDLELSNEMYTHTQIGHYVDKVTDETYMEDIADVDLILLCCADSRGRMNSAVNMDSTMIRKAFYRLENWQKLRIADFGDVKVGLHLNDTYVVMEEIILFLLSLGPRIVVLGGGDDLMVGMYRAFAKRKQLIDITLIDSHLDFQPSSVIHAYNYLHELLLAEPNFTKHLNLLGFQSYFVPPDVLNVLDSLRFDFLRLGRVKEQIMDAEPYIRNSELIGFDMDSIRFPDHVSQRVPSVNGLNGEESCALTKYIGMSDKNKIVGIFNINTSQNPQSTSLLIAQMLWYYMDGLEISKMEASFGLENEYLNFSVEAQDVTFKFCKSRRTSRWWINIKGREWLPCSHQDYVEASNNHIPERWMRAMEK